MTPLGAWATGRASFFMSSVLLLFATAAAAQTPAAGEFRVTAYTTNHQTRARPAMEPDGDFVIVWQSRYQDGDQVGTFGQRFAASGAPRGTEFRINADTTGFQGYPALAVGNGGDFVVVWTSREEIQARRFDAAGSAIGGEFRVNTLTPGRQYRPNVGRAFDGRFVVAWTSQNDGSSTGIAARRFDASGNPIGSEFRVNTHTTDYQKTGDVAVDANGNFVVVWEDYDHHDGDGLGVFGQRYDAAGDRLGTEFQVNSYTPGSQQVPSVSVSPPGGFVVAFVGGGYGSHDMYSRRFDAAGNAAGNDVRVNTYTTGAQVGTFGQIAHDAGGNFVVTWQGPGDGGAAGVFAQRFRASGARRGAEFRVNTYTTGDQTLPRVSSDAVGNFVVGWQSDGQDGSAFGIFAQRFGGLGPAALTVDSQGNRVLEPGETVDVRPTWRNFNGAPQTFGGALTDITGPAGPTYTITDPAGDYGTVANGATAQCAECYAVSVSDPATRPAVHWDASAVESIVPDTQGQQKRWLLHVGRSFTDVPGASGFYRFIETLLHHGVTGGCSPTQYCPASSTTREQMAVFVLVAKEGVEYVPPACVTPMFADVPASSPFCRWIEELALRAVIGGCGGGNYCPSSAVTREQMAVFVLRTLDPALVPPACTTPIYADVPASSPFCRWIEELTRRNVVTGCGGGNYCPTAAVTREQMGVFLSVTFGLALYGV